VGRGKGVRGVEVQPGGGVVEEEDEVDYVRESEAMGISIVSQYTSLLFTMFLIAF
jgi:hypothetical protein